MLLIILSITVYLYFKVIILRTDDPLYQVYSNSRARIALGVFMIAFGANQYVFYQTRLALAIALVFVALGVAQFVYGYRRAKFYRKQLRERT
ncbi:YtpI family protein [Pontibacillus halophilus]|uniref:YtpI family protein n=1 Tax=Pontibacillus halophilus TaxID=516704 RepID=UPI00041D2872|nr:YtpI family protein [Pontibacillus halophilus]